MKFIRPNNHNCKISMGVCESFTFGDGELDYYGYWEKPCPECARAHEKQFPEQGRCWPFEERVLGILDKTLTACKI